MRSGPNQIYRLLHKDYAESFSYYSPQSQDFYDVVEALLPEGWRIQREDMWFYCSPPRPTFPLQGWKIHVSATMANSREVLKRVVSVLRHKDVSFKFALDRSLLSLLNSKGWPRGRSGKFITIYPADSRHFLELIEEVHEATAGMQGPYILSDYRYNDSGVVFYRYGGMRMHTELNVKGEKVPVLRRPDGNVVPDQRLPYAVVPPWETPVLPVENCKDEIIALHGRYIILEALTFSNAGGVYRALDKQTGNTVILKEARPWITAATDDHDAIEMLKKEYRLLTAVADLDIAPQPVELFQEWEHWFLVEKFIEGVSLRHHAAAHNIVLRTRATREEREQWRKTFAKLAAELLRIIALLHERGIIFADLSANNLIVTGDGNLKIIDFEGAHRLGVDRPANIFTPGFVSRHRVAGGEARWEDDYYAAGAVLLAYLLPINELLHLNPQAHREFIFCISADLELPGGLVRLINELIEHPESAAQGPAIVEVPTDAVPHECDGEPPLSPLDYDRVVGDIVRHLNRVASYERTDRLYPADPRVFSTNPISLAYGAAGVAYALHKITGQTPRPVIDWILQHRITCSEYPPGLYVGMSGIAWSLLEMGATKPAEEIFQLTFNHPLLSHSPDLFHGMAGWGMAALRFFLETGKDMYLEQAERAAEELLASRRESQQGYFWSSPDETRLGLAHGSSGIALFLLYLHLATRDERYLTTGMCALEFDIAAATPTKDGGLSYSESLQIRSPLYPYWRSGSAGVGAAVARFQRFLRLPRYEAFLEQIFIDTDRKYAVFPGRLMGLAGLGEFLLDMHDLTGDLRFQQSAQKAAEGIMHFRIQRSGLAFPGELLSRLCCDFGTGSAGIALFLNRLLGRQKGDFMLDQLFDYLPVEEVKSQSLSHAVI
jgi:tRNA A-37 threonylcarbamoyl transferase component Bud32